MKKAILLHGTEGSSQSCWLQWLGGALSSQQLQVWIPDLPNADNPSLEEWLNYVKNNSPFIIDSDTIIVGHSAGAVLAIIIAQFFEVKMTVSVGAFKDLTYLHEKLNWHANDRFFDIDFEFDKVKQNTSNRVFVHSDNDPYCPLEQTKYLSAKLDAKLVIYEGQGHFNTESDKKYSKFPELLQLINTYL